VARGQQPSAQRNAALKPPRDIIYFLDDDSVPEPGNLRRGVSHFKDPRCKWLAAEPVPEDAPPLEQVFAQVLASWLAFGPSRARYARWTGAETSEKELILCNQLARRQSMLDLGGFNEALYPMRRMRSWTSCRSKAAS